MQPGNRPSVPVEVLRLEDDEQQVAARASLLVGVHHLADRCDLVADLYRLEIFKTVAAVQPPLAIFLGLRQMCRDWRERDKVRRRRLGEPARVGIADRLREPLEVAGLDDGGGRRPRRADAGTQPVDNGWGCAHLPRGSPRTRSAMML